MTTISVHERGSDHGKIFWIQKVGGIFITRNALGAAFRGAKIRAKTKFSPFRSHELLTRLKYSWSDPFFIRNPDLTTTETQRTQRCTEKSFGVGLESAPGAF